jgi:hypothetical protein
MRGMKITVDAAMRARDVSRPRAEHEALARESDAAAESSRRTQAPAGPAAPSGAGRPARPAGTAAGAPERASRPRGRRHRRR